MIESPKFTQTHTNTHTHLHTHTHTHEIQGLASFWNCDAMLADPHAKDRSISGFEYEVNLSRMHVLSFLTRRSGLRCVLCGTQRVMVASYWEH